MVSVTHCCCEAQVDTHNGVPAGCYYGHDNSFLIAMIPILPLFFF